MVPALRPRYIPYSYMDPLGVLVGEPMILRLTLRVLAHGRSYLWTLAAVCSTSEAADTLYLEPVRILELLRALYLGTWGASGECMLGPQLYVKQWPLGCSKGLWTIL